ncbi:glycosyltransferase family 4 protein [Carboxylicivirga sp. M1479]|uniref:glycosyltransferase family 4 protein n=1 Tax=Carboxylicivirga sp. M1479 TaxID=2594476 RepID=UPI00117775CD|nr:glycosyltransferase family 4 protein [Carboxylicivirga sp. M1479]TRX72005.1 glycosyltransferase family 4 protein [Carboxylicivirga sp. M1479]
MKILILSKDYPPTIGGVENYSYYIAEGLGRNNDVQVLTFKGRDKENTWPDTVRVKRISLGIKVPEAVKGLFLVLYLFFNALIKKPDYVFATTWKVGYPAMLLKKLFSYKLVITCHGAEITRHKDSSDTMDRMKETLSVADQLIAVSEFTKAKTIEYASVSADKVTVVPNGVDLSKMNVIPKEKARKRIGFEKDCFYALTVSRVDSRKGHEKVLSAIPSILDKYPHFRYVIVGNGPEKEKLQKLCVELGIDSIVRFAGYVESELLDYYYSAADTFVMINTMTDDKDFEGFGLVFAEAGYYGLPLIGGNNSGPKEVIVHNESGFLINGDVDSVVASVTTLMRDAESCKKLGEKAKELTCKRFSVDYMVENTNLLLNEL